jgi:hypothetical protein
MYSLFKGLNHIGSKIGLVTFFEVQFKIINFIFYKIVLVCIFVLAILILAMCTHMASNYIGMCHPILYNPYVIDAYPRIYNYKTQWLILDSNILFGEFFNNLNLCD